MKEDNFVSAVVCLDNGSGNAYDFLAMTGAVFKRNFKHWEFICVGAGLEDDVIDSVQKFKQENKDVAITMIDMGFPQGLEASMRAGIDLAIGDYIFEFDTCAVDYGPEVVTELYRKATAGCDIVAAVPSRPKSRLLSKMFYFIYNRFSKSGGGEIGPERFRILSRRAVNRTCAYGRIIPYRKAVYASSGLKMGNVTYEAAGTEGQITDRDSGRMNTAIDALVIFTDLAYRLSLCISVWMAVFMVLAGCYTVVVYFGMNKPVEGWAPLMGMISLAFFAVFVILTMIIKYLDVLLKLVFKKQKYLVSAVEKL